MKLRELYIKIERYAKNKQYQSLFPAPPYDIWKPYSSKAPSVYNYEGRAYDYYYLRDIHSAATPYDDTGKYFIWDRYNYAFPIHFYSHREMFTNIGQPTKKYGMMVESRAIVPYDYRLLEKRKGFEREFDKIFTFDDKILNDCSNAAYVPFSAAPWYGRANGLINDSERYGKKEKNVSLLSSDKIQTEIHRKRVALAKYCRDNDLCDVYGRAVGGGYVDIDNTLRDYRFTFAIENFQTDYYFTEKITNCFAAQSIPIYYGARKIDDFFNPEGIIKIEEKDFDNIEEILKQCTAQEYERRLPAIIDNYNRVMKDYKNMQDYLFERYLKDEK